ncbi:MAG: hypothetical protein KF721_16030, partial [Ignavibacteriaceae bacterium]|nr:hypothetical protein [Ignavibacteriaceae bacterium]
MNLLCKLNLHKWKGCKCIKCSTTRDELHNWEGCRCVNCGKTKEHKYHWKSSTLACKICSEQFSSDESFYKYLIQISDWDANSFGFDKNIEYAINKIKATPYIDRVALEAESINVRKIATCEVNDQKVLSEIVLDDRNNDRYSPLWDAIDRINQIDLLKMIADRHKDNGIKEMVGKRIEDIEDRLRSQEITSIEDQQTLKEMYIDNDNYPKLLKAIIEKITNQNILRELYGIDDKHKKTIIQKIKDDKYLEKIVADYSEDIDIVLFALNQITDQDILMNICLREDLDRQIRRAA